MLLLHHAAPLHWAVGGATIAVITLALFYLTNRRLGLSSSLEDLCSLAIQHPYFQRGAVEKGRPWRLPFVGGLVIGGFVSAVSTGGWAPTWEVGMLDAAAGLGHAGTLAWMFVGGLCIGVGTRLAGGCTSGHGIFGLSNLEWPSLVAVLSFFGSGIVMTHLVYRVFLG